MVRLMTPKDGLQAAYVRGARGRREDRQHTARDGDGRHGEARQRALSLQSRLHPQGYFIADVIALHATMHLV